MSRGANGGPAVRLVCLDVDGTLVGSSGVVHPAVWEAAERARAAGIHVAVCSGRPAFGATRAIAERLEPGGWHGFQNGASVVHLASGASRSARMPADTVAALVEHARDTGRLLELYSDDDYAIEHDSPRARAHAALLGVPFRPRPLEALAGPVVRAQWLVPRAEAEAAVAEAPAGLEVSPSTASTMPDTIFVNLTPAGFDKGAAVRALAEAHGIPLEQVMFVGDGLNDLPALAVVGHPVAMANAEPEARAAARHLVGDVDGGGAAEALALAIDA